MRTEFINKHILTLLKDNQRGLSIREISELVKVNRNSVSNYLNLLLVSGQVEVRELGPAKVFYLSQRVPMSDLLNIFSDSVVVINSSGNIIQVNETCINVLGISRTELVNKPLSNVFSYVSFDSADLISEKMYEGLNGKESTIETSVSWESEIAYFNLKFIPTVFADGDPGVIIIAADITARAQLAT